jgi:mutator protein MutT
MTDCVISVIHEGPRFAIAKRDREPFEGFWEFPGGKRENSETLEGCAKREAQEEAGLAIAIERKLMTIKDPYPDMNIDLHYFLCGVKDGSVPPQRFKWVHVNQLNEYTFPPANDRLIAELHKIFS